MTIAVDLKTCRRCDESKDVSAFPRHARTRDRRSSWCAECHNGAKRASRRKRRAEALLAEAVELEQAAKREAGWRAQWSLSHAEHLRRQAARELAPADAAY